MLQQQYIFIHDALAETVACGNTEFSVQELPDKLRVLNSVVPDSGNTLMVGEFMVWTFGVFLFVFLHSFLSAQRLQRYCWECIQPVNETDSQSGRWTKIPSNEKYI